eukprot:1775479-Heterocapsa_arctica.AAC.1
MAGGRKGQRDRQIPAAGGRGTEGGFGLGPTHGHAAAQRRGGSQHDQEEGPEERKVIGRSQGKAGQ